GLPTQQRHSGQSPSPTGSISARPRVAKKKAPGRERRSPRSKRCVARAARKREREGQVENQVGLVRERVFTPRLRVKSYDELNAWLTDKCIAYAKAHHHPELTGQTIWQAFEAERPKLVPYAGRFDGFHAVPTSVSKTCLVPSMRCQHRSRRPAWFASTTTST